MAPIPISRAEFEAKFGAAPAASEPAAPIRITRAEYEAKFAPPSVPQLLGNPESDLQAFGRTAIGGLSRMIPFGDEIVAGGSSVLDALAGDAPLGEAYDQRLAEIRGYKKAFANTLDAETPHASTAFDLASALMMPLPKALSVGGAAVGAAAPTLGKTALQLAKQGGALGALYGFSEAEGGVGRRLSSALTGGVSGGIAGPLIGLPLGAGAGYVLNRIAEARLPERIKAVLPSIFSSQRGAVGGSKPAPTIPEGYSPEEIIFAKQARGVPLEQVEHAKRILDQSIEHGIPLKTPEALDSNKVYRNARFIANYEPSLEYSQRILNARADDAGRRITTALDEMITPNVGSTMAGAEVKAAAKQIVKGLKGTRAAETRPLYEGLENQRLANNTVLKLLDDPIIASALDSAQKDPIMQKLAGTADPRSFRWLQLTKQHLNDEVTSLRRLGKNQRAMAVQDSHEKLSKALDKMEGFEEANEAYRRLSQPINRMEGTREEPGLLRAIIKKPSIKTQEIPDELLKLEPSQIREVVAKMNPKQQESVRRSARASLQDVMREANEQNQPALLLLKNQDIRDRFRAMLGDTTYEAVAGRIDLEKIMARARNRYGTGSTTATNLAEDASFKKDTSLIRQLFTLDYQGLIERLMQRGMSEDTAMGLARIYFDPARGSEALGKIRPLIERYGTADRVASRLASEAEAAAPVIGQEVGQANQQRGRSARGSKPQIPTANQAAAAQGSQSAVGGLSKSTQATRLQGIADTPIAARQAQAAPPNQSRRVQSGQGSKSSSNYRPDPKVAQATKRTVSAYLGKSPIAPLVNAMIEVESAWNPHATSKAGARGLMQIMPANFKALGVKDPSDPIQSVRGGVKLLQEEYNRFKDPRIALAAYNAGSPAVNRAIDKAREAGLAPTWPNIKRFLPPETQQYVPKVEDALTQIVRV